MDLTTYDFVVVNSSAGKDSQAMLDLVTTMAREQGVLDRVVVVHCDLGRMEWEGTKELAQRQASHYGVRFEIVKRTQNDLLGHVRDRGMWPSSAARYCTSEHKRGPVGTLFTRLTNEWRDSSGLKYDRPCRILNCMGMRAQESPARAKLPVLKRDERNTNGRRVVDIWLPLHAWTVEQVWDRIKASGVEHHRAYDLGMPRLSCVFCIFSPKSALLLAGKHNPELLAEYVQVEQQISHSFRKDLRLTDIQNELLQGVQPGAVEDWRM